MNFEFAKLAPGIIKTVKAVMVISSAILRSLIEPLVVDLLPLVADVWCFRFSLVLRFGDESDARESDAR